MKMTGAQIIMEVLLEQGVDTVFGYPGGAVLNIYDELYKSADRIRHILTAHEQGAAHAADGYSRATGKTGVVFATSGPGATNLVTGIATAYMDSIPLVAITGNVALSLLGRDSFQEVDITGITMPITKHNYIVKNIMELADTIREAFRIANTGRKGPVLVDVPKDITAMECEFVPKAATLPLPAREPKASRMDQAVALLQACKKPLIYLGGGIISSNASAELLSLAEKLQIPVVSSTMALGGFPHHHPLHLGMIGMHGTYIANWAAHNCDLLLVAGARFSDRVAGNRASFASKATIIHVDIDAAEMDKNVHSALHIAADLQRVLTILYDRLPPCKHEEWLEEIKAPKGKVGTRKKDGYVNPRDLIEKVAAMVPGDTIVATDVGQHQMWVAQFYPFEKPRTLLTSGGLGTMGYGLGAAIGAKVGMPDKTVVLFSGDGSFHMNLQEITTLVSYQLKVIVLVMNNQVLGMVRQWQKAFYEGRFSATDPHRKTDIKKLAEAFGATGMRIEKPEEMDSVLQAAFAEPGPVVIDCHISPDVNVLPMIPPGGDLADTIDDMDV